MKSIWQSKTFLVNLATAAVAVLTYFQGSDFIATNPQAVAILGAVVAVLNIILRTVTDTPVSLGSDPAMAMQAYVPDGIRRIGCWLAIILTLALPSPSYAGDPEAKVEARRQEPTQAIDLDSLLDQLKKIDAVRPKPLQRRVTVDLTQLLWGCGAVLGGAAFWARGEREKQAMRRHVSAMRAATPVELPGVIR